MVEARRGAVSSAIGNKLLYLRYFHAGITLLPHRDIKNEALETKM
jgi:hypothetical protein